MINNDNLRKIAEEKVSVLPENIDNLSRDEILKMFHDLNVHQIELEMQNEELRRMQTELDISRERYFDLYEIAPVGYLTVNEKGMIIESNLTAANLFGTTRSMMIHYPFSNFIKKEDQEIFYMLRHELLTSEKQQLCELRINNANKKDQWVQLTATPATDTEGNATLRIVINDMTNRKQIEDVQQFLAKTSSGLEEESFFNVLAEFLADKLNADFVCIDRLEGDGLNARTVAVWCDGQFEDNVTYALKDTPCGDVVGKTVCCFPASVCQFFPRDQILQDLKAESYAGVTLWSHTSLPIGLIAVIKRSQFDNQAMIENILKLVSGRAASEMERIDAEQDKIKLEAQLRQAMKMESIGRLAGGVAHDFNNMLQAILGNAELALNDISADSPLKENLEEIQKCANRSADLTRQLLAFARKQTIMPRVLDLNETLTGMLKMLYRLIGEDVELNWVLNAKIWQVNMDPSQIDQIMANLCINARDSIAGVGKLTIETKNCIVDEKFCEHNESGIPGEYVSISISDNGCGIKKELLNDIFEPFFTTKGVGKGTGLGLSTVLGIIQQNHGFITIDSEVGEGSTFTVYFPRYISIDKLENKQNDDLFIAPGNETVLLVEDELTILKLTISMLQKLGYSVLTANSPGKAIQIAKEHSIGID
jgi:PAS domain S-box-containing protein